LKLFSVLFVAFAVKHLFPLLSPSAVKLRKALAVTGYFILIMLLH